MSRWHPKIGWHAVVDAVLHPSPEPALDGVIATRARQEAPVVWLIGKVQSGKTSIVRAITGQAEAQIGSGYKPCTQTARVFDFPQAAPVIRFLDTSGFGGTSYDPTPDLALLEKSAHVVLAVARALDPEQSEVLAVLRAVRERHPAWAVVLAQTHLHEAYADGADHPAYADLATAPGLDDLRRSLAAQAAAFEALPGDGPVRAVPVDLTHPDDGFNDPQFGLPALLDALENAGSAGMRTILRNLTAREADLRAARARPHVLGFALAAGASDIVPLIGWVSVPAIQAKMLHSIGRIYGLAWNARTLREFAASLGAGTAARIGLGFGIRQLTKLVPAYGQTLGAAAAGTTSFAVTYAIGRAACHYLGLAQRGHTDAAGVARTYRKALHEAFTMVGGPKRERQDAGERGGTAHGA
jgi:uncharacterized protein (DUF697 family)